MKPSTGYRNDDFNFLGMDPYAQPNGTYAAASTSTTTTMYEEWTTGPEPSRSETKTGKMPPNSPHDAEVKKVDGAFPLTHGNDMNYNHRDSPLIEAGRGMEEEDLHRPINQYSYELEAFRLERRCVMLTKLFETWAKMEIEMERTIFQLKTSSVMKNTEDDSERS
jgi:hypothetical protein